MDSQHGRRTGPVPGATRSPGWGKSGSVLWWWVVLALDPLAYSDFRNKTKCLVWES